MKTGNFLSAYLLLAASMFACAPDNGNYNYSEVNKITIQGMVEEYSVDQMDTLWVDSLRLDFSLEETDNLAYEWVIKKQGGVPEIISTTKNCGGKITQAPGSYSQSWLCVANLDTGLKYYWPFRLTVNTSWENGLYILSEAADGTAKLSMQRRDRENAPLVSDVFESCNPELGVLGQKPVQLSYADGYVSSPVGLYVICQEGERKISYIDDRTMQLQQYWNETLVEGWSGDFTPKYLNNFTGATILDENGSVFSFNYSGNMTLYRPFEGRNFSWLGGEPAFSNEMNYAYDEDDDCFYVLANTENSLLFDELSPIEEFNTEGMTFWNSGHKLGDDGWGWILYPILYDPETQMEHYFEISVTSEYNDEWELIKYYSYKEKCSRPVTVEQDGVCLLSNMDYWYASKGKRVIRYFFSDKSVPQDWTAELEGEITAMIFDEEQSRLFVAAYDGTKSYIHEVSASETMKELAKPLEVDGKVVSMCATGSWTY